MAMLSLVHVDHQASVLAPRRSMENAVTDASGKISFIRPLKMLLVFHGLWNALKQDADFRFQDTQNG